MSTNEPANAQPAPAAQCSNPTCRATFATPVQQCLTCSALLSGRLLSERFRIEALLGRGGMGAVYRATDLALGRQVAVKVLAPSGGLAGDAPDQLRARFFREARLAAQLDHPNIVAILHFDLDGPLAYLVMPLLTGGTLARRVRPKRPTDPTVVAGWLRQIASALDFAHKRPQPIVHRDVKPGNLLFHEDGRLCLADFGIARVVASTESSEVANLTRPGVVVGSLAYMAPEQINGHAIPASDQYSVGVMLYELLTGELPFEAADSYGLIILHASVHPIPPSERLPGLPPGLDAVVLRALAKEPAERFPSLGALAAAFSDALSKAGTAHLQGASQPRPTLPVAPRPTLAFSNDPRGELPTQAATMLRPRPAPVPSGMAGPAFAPPGAPPQLPPQPPRRRRRTWLIVLSASLLTLCLCVVLLAALSKQGQTAKSNASATSTAAAASPTPNPYQALLQQAEGRRPLFQDQLNRNSHDWQRCGKAEFKSDGLHLSGGENDTGHADCQNAQNASAFHAGISLSNCDIEIDLRFISASIAYGFGLFPRTPPNHIIGLNSNGEYLVSKVIFQGTMVIPDGPKQGSDPGLVLTPDETYHLALLIQPNGVTIFLGQPHQALQYILTIPYSPGFAGSGVLSLANLGENTTTSPTELIYSNLAIYPLA